MTTLAMPGRDYDAAMREVAAGVARNTYLVVGAGPCGETHAEHARPYLDAVLRADELRHELGPGWTVTAVPVRSVAR
ncbi:hypothetical protein [Dactylosporangium sp. CA-139066]|uniref:hypothetical protein n=1 Tax=Dactylosporangium sp. CA-139066 TaxID=3239930 RepID=UPI003D926DD1